MSNYLENIPREWCLYKNANGVSDDLLLPNKLKLQVEAGENNPGTGLVGPWKYFTRVGGAYSTRPGSWITRDHSLAAQHPLSCPHL